VHGDGVVVVAPVPLGEGQVPPSSLGVLLETLQDPGNVGTILRTASAAGINQVWLTGDSVDLTHPKLLRSSAGSWFDVTLQDCGDPVAWIEDCRRGGVQIVATSSHASADYWTLDFTRPTLLLMGNEGAGLSQRLQDQADRVVKIPVDPRVESLNVAIATALMVYEAKRQWWIQASPSGQSVDQG
jgi:TrmH family RNA methyltransferase